MISQDVIQRIVKQEKAMQEIEGLLKAIAQEVEEFDNDVLLAPAEIEEEDGRAYWEFLGEDSAKKEKSSVADLSDECKDDEDEEEEFEDEKDDDRDDWDDEDEEEEDDEDEEGGEEITIGVYLWSPEPEKAVLSIYLEYCGYKSSYEEDWKRLKELKAKLDGKIHLYHDEWGDDKLEVERIDLEELMQGKVKPEDIAKKVYSIAQKVCSLQEMRKMGKYVSEIQDLQN